jgi:hypothetical protein
MGSMGRRSPGDETPRALLSEQDGIWKIKDFQNTNAVPETAFPKTR